MVVFIEILFISAVVGSLLFALFVIYRLWHD